MDVEIPISDDILDYYCEKIDSYGGWKFPYNSAFINPATGEIVFTKPSKEFTILIPVDSYLWWKISEGFKEREKRHIIRTYLNEKLHETEHL